MYVGRRDCSSLADNLGWQLDAVAGALRSVDLDTIPPVIPVLCFVDGEWPLLFPPNSDHGVRLEGTRSIRTLITAEQLLDDHAIDRLI